MLTSGQIKFTLNSVVLTQENTFGQLWWCMSVILTCWKVPCFELSLGNLTRLGPKIKKKSGDVAQCEDPGFKSQYNITHTRHTELWSSQSRINFILWPSVHKTEKHIHVSLPSLHSTYKYSTIWSHQYYYYLTVTSFICNC